MFNTKRTHTEFYKQHTTWLPTTIPGLKAIPSLPENWNTLDWLPAYNAINWVRHDITGNGQFSDNNRAVLTNIIKSRANPDLFVEIGTAISWEKSSTETFIKCKSEDTTFYTIDIIYRECPEKDLNLKNTHFIKSPSVDESIKSRIGSHKIDILFIDGDHSVDMVFKEYSFYLPHMKKDGIIVLHDITVHPGPFLFMEAVDENVYRKEILHEDDLGLGIVYLG